MRVVSGTKKGLRLTEFKNLSIRPTADSTKEVIFNVLRGFVRDSVVLDVFAGTGSLGIEALSCGAAKAIFIENDKHAQEVIFKNLTKSGFLESSEVIRGNAEKVFRRLQKSGLKFDLIFMDPPYRSKLASTALDAVTDNQLLTSQGWVVLEQDFRSSSLNPNNGLTLKLKKRQGDTDLFFFQNG